MRETRLSGSEGGGAVAGSPYPYLMSLPFGEHANRTSGVQPEMWDTISPRGEGRSHQEKQPSPSGRGGTRRGGWVRAQSLPQY